MPFLNWSKHLGCFDWNLFSQDVLYCLYSTPTCTSCPNYFCLQFLTWVTWVFQSFLLFFSKLSVHKIQRWTAFLCIYFITIFIIFLHFFISMTTSTDWTCETLWTCWCRSLASDPRVSAGYEEWYRPPAAWHAGRWWNDREQPPDADSGSQAETGGQQKSIRTRSQFGWLRAETARATSAHLQSPPTTLPLGPFLDFISGSFWNLFDTTMLWNMHTVSKKDVILYYIICYYITLHYIILYYTTSCYIVFWYIILNYLICCTIFYYSIFKLYQYIYHSQMINICNWNCNFLTILTFHTVVRWVKVTCRMIAFAQNLTASSPGYRHLDLCASSYDFQTPKHVSRNGLPSWR